MSIKHRSFAGSIFTILLSACAFGLLQPQALRSAESLEEQSKEAVETFKKTDSDMKKFFDEAVGYAIFPSVAKGAAGIGAAHGKGLVYEKAELIGESTLTQVTIGLQLGGQTYSELIFFETKETLDQFKAGKPAF